MKTFVRTSLFLFFLFSTNTTFADTPASVLPEWEKFFTEMMDQANAIFAKEGSVGERLSKNKSIFDARTSEGQAGACDHAKVMFVEDITVTRDRLQEKFPNEKVSLRRVEELHRLIPEINQFYELCHSGTLTPEP